MRNKILALAVLLGVGLAHSLFAAYKPPQVEARAQDQRVQRERISTPRVERLGPATRLTPVSLTTDFNDAASCTVYVDEPQFALYGWMEGYEIYYVYQDLRFPRVNCDTTFPFVVTYVGMTLVLNNTGSFNMQVFLTEVDPLYSSPVCPIPGELIYLSDEYPVEIYEPGVYSVAIGLETPAPVYGPYFACIYFGSDMYDFYPGLAIDAVPYLCINYNEWGVGLVDLADNDYYNFPGSIHLFSEGYSKAGTLPMPRFILPVDSAAVQAGGRLWAADRNDQYQFASAKFEYRKAGVWYELNSDFDGLVAKRDGVTPALTRDGWAVTWNPYGLTEGNYPVRVSIADFDSTYISDTVNVYLDLKPLAPTFVNRTDLMSTCGAETLRVHIADENPTAVTFGFRHLPPIEERILPLLKRNDYGDVDGDFADGNHNYDGEFGEYYVAPAVFASFMKHWFDKGYIELMANGSSFYTTQQLVEELAAQFGTRTNFGTEDDDLVDELQQWIAAHGNRFTVDVRPQPDREWFKAAYMGHQATVALAVSSPFGNWLAAQKVNYDASTGDSLVVTYYDPVGGLLRESFLIGRGDSLVLGYLPNNRKYTVPLGIALYPKQEALTYTAFGTDFTFIDGFWTVIPPAYFQEDLLYLIRARALDGNNSVADSYWLMKYDCVHPARRGDADNDNIVSVSDAVYLISFIFGSGPAPLTTVHGDADCDGLVSVSDAVYLISYIFGSGPAPCP